MSFLLSNLPEIVSMILFGIGVVNLLLANNLIKKIIGLNIMDSAGYLFLAAKGYIQGRIAPIIPAEAAGSVDPSLYVNPIPAGLVLTGIVVSVSVTAISLALTVRLYERFHTINLDEILAELREREREEEQ